MWTPDPIVFPPWMYPAIVALITALVLIALYDDWRNIPRK